MTEMNSDRLKHLEMTQAVIARMAGESAGIKRFALVSFGIVAATAKAVNAPSLALIGCVVAAVFWFLDSKYLLQERWYRAHFDELRAGSGPTDFNMKPSDASQTKHSLPDAMFGWSTVPIYGVMILLSLALALVIQPNAPAPL